ncbi:cupin domain-containing protein, partial [Staphylococcus epidermidis]|uniref:cupin domain-containing protein n=1 Tax=Staphylococcus epidermidis TaxID=1282 RepID=UPI0016426323
DFDRIDGDEVWYYDGGERLKIDMIRGKGEYDSVKLGRDIDCGECLEYCVGKGTIFASSLDSAEGYSVVGCMRE